MRYSGRTKPGFVNNSPGVLHLLMSNDNVHIKGNYVRSHHIDNKDENGYLLGFRNLFFGGHEDTVDKNNKHHKYTETSCTSQGNTEEI